MQAEKGMQIANRFNLAYYHKSCVVKLVSIPLLNVVKIGLNGFFFNTLISITTFNTLIE
jgi:hypothetical protein